MAPSTAAESGVSSGPSNIFPLVLKGIEYGSTPFTARTYSLLMLARPQDTVDQVLCGLGHQGGAVLHVVHADRHLPPGATIGDLGLPRYANLLVTPYPDAWCLVYKIAMAATRFHHQTLLWPEQRLGAPPASPEQLSRDTVRLVQEFLDKAAVCLPGRMIGEFLDVFVCSGLAHLLVRLYVLSTWPVHHYRAKAAMECFLDSSTTVRMPPHVEAWTAPLCLSFCQAMVYEYPGNNGREDPLYKSCRSKLAAVVALHEHILPKEWVIENLTPFAVETANEVIADYNHGFMPSTDALLEFKTFYSVLCRELPQVSQQSDDFSPSPSQQREPQPMHQAIVLLTLTAIELLLLADHLMARLPPQLPWSEHAELPAWAHDEDIVNMLWVLLSAVDSWSEGRSDRILLAALRETIRTRAARLNALVLGTGAARTRQEDVVGLSPRLKRVLRFEARRHLAAAMLPTPLSAGSGGHFELRVDRARLLEDSLACVSRASRHELLSCELTVQFLHEEASHSVREWLALVCRELFDPQRALFSPCPRNHRRFFLNAADHPLNLQYLNFAGRMIGLALMHKVQVGVLFDRTLFLQLAMDDIAEDPLLALDDIADADPLLHSSCRHILEMDPAVIDSGVPGLTMTRGGRDVAVNSLNRKHIVDELITDTFVSSTKEQLVSFAEGFSSMLVDPGMRGAFFRSLYLEDLDKMLGGSMGAIDVEEWKGNVEYRGYSEEDEQIKWFWEAVETMTAEEQRRLLFFWTSVEYLPFDGFRGVGFGRLIIARAFNDTPDHLPSSSTCLNLLSLPSYTSFAMMLSRLKIIAQGHVCCGFGTV